METKERSYIEALQTEGLEMSHDFPRFLDLYGKVGNWVVGQVLEFKTIKFTPKKGKQAGKPTEKGVYIMEVISSNIDGVEDGETVTLSPAGLLAWQLEDGKPAGVILPFKIGIRFVGRDAQDRLQTKVEWPKANAVK